MLYTEAELSDSLALTPAHFLLGNVHIGVPDNFGESDPDPNFNADSADVLLLKWKRTQHCLNQFWKSWRNEYLTSIRERNPYRKQRGACSAEPKSGDVVLVKDNLPRGKWKLGKIESPVTGKDGLCRAAIIRMGNGKQLQRPIKLLFPIEYTRRQDDDKPETITESNRDAVASLRCQGKAALKAKEWLHDLLCPECHDGHHETD